MLVVRYFALAYGTLFTDCVLYFARGPFEPDRVRTKVEYGEGSYSDTRNQRWGISRCEMSRRHAGKGELPVFRVSTVSFLYIEKITITSVFGLVP